MLAEFSTQIWRRNRPLAMLGWVHAALFATTILLAVVDDRQVMGVNTWIKPMKFMFSLAVYLWTIAWISEYIRRPRWLLGLVTWTIFSVIIIETACLLIQAGRGTTSHYNLATDFDQSIFSTMGLMIAIDMLMTVVILIMLRKPSKTLHLAYLWGIRLGIVIFLFGGWIGGQMIAQNAHTVGAPDGGPGLPLLNWSTIAGDLRIAHGLGLHALQILPLAGFGISHWPLLRSDAVKLATMILFAFVYFLAVLVPFRQALSGQPIL
jgi:hypothetical protein